MTTGEKLRILRERSGTIQEDLVRILNARYPGIGFTRDQYANWENDRNYPRWDAAKALVLYYRITLDDLFFEDKTQAFQVAKKKSLGRVNA